MGTLSAKCPRIWDGVGILAPAVRPGQKVYIRDSEFQLQLWFFMADKAYDEVLGTQRVKWVSVDWLGYEVAMEQRAP